MSTKLVNVKQFIKALGGFCRIQSKKDGICQKRRADTKRVDSSENWSDSRAKCTKPRPKSGTKPLSKCSFKAK